MIRFSSVQRFHLEKGDLLVQNMALNNAYSERVILNPRIKPTHYSLELSPDLDAFTFSCSEQIKLTISEANLTAISLHSKEISIDEASLSSSNGGAWNLENISYNLKLTTVTLSFDKALPVGDVVLSIKYRGLLNGDMVWSFSSLNPSYYPYLPT